MRSMLCSYARSYAGRHLYLLSVASLELRRLLTYRTEFWISFLGAILTQLTLAYFLWDAIFSYRNVERLGGYSFAGLMFYYLFSSLAAQIMRGREIFEVSKEIYDGSLTRYLVYPISFFSYRLAARLAELLLALLQLGIILLLSLAIFSLPEEISITPLSVSKGLLALLIAVALHFYMGIVLELAAFWADNVWSLLILLRFVIALLGGGMIPLSFFPDWSQALLPLLPFYYLIAFPVQNILGLQSIGLQNSAAFWPGVLVALLWTIFFILSARLIWQRGLLRYTGVGM